MSYTVEVKTEGLKTRESRRSATVSYEVIWLDWDAFKIIPIKSGNRHLVSDGKRCFQILKGKARQKYLEENGYTPKNGEGDSSE